MAKTCPNCRNKSLEEIGNELVCHECEYHTHGRKAAKGSFR